VCSDAGRDRTKVLFHCLEISVLTQSIGMEVTYELTQRDFLDSFIAHRNRSKFRKWSFRILVSAILVVVGVGLIAVAVQPNRQALASFGPLVVLGVMWVALMWVTPWWAARRQFSKQPSAQGPRTVLLDAEGIHWRWSGGSADAAWQNYVRFLEARDQILFYSSPACFNIVPKRALTPGQLSELRALLARNLPHSR
jgi:YcxB-like protein